METVQADKKGDAHKRASWFGIFRHGHRSQLSRTERAIIGAEGRALIMLVSLLHARGHLDMKEVSSMLGLFSVVVGEENELEGDILALWAAMMKDVAPGQAHPGS